MASEREVAANTVVVLLVHGVIDRSRWRPAQIAASLEMPLSEIAAAHARKEADGIDALMPGADDTINESRNEERGTRNAKGVRPQPDHPGERQCVRCGEWWPVEEFVESSNDARPLDGYRRKMCKPCFGQFERGHFIAIKNVPRVFGELRAYFTASAGDDCFDKMCERCGKPIEEGQNVNVRGLVEHTTCPK